jgi:dihydrolipoamide dehydrogenase
MAANDGPIPVRTLAHAARLMREARQLGFYGISVSEPALDYSRLLARVREVVAEVRACSAFREQIDASGATVYERSGSVRFIDAHTIESETGQRLQAGKIIICTGGASRRLSVPGSELTATHSDAWSLTAVPESMLVIGAGATGAQIASIFNAFGSRVQIFQAGARILPTEDADVSAEVAAAFRRAGITVRENFGVIESFEKTASGVRMIFAKDGARGSAEAALAVVAVGWVANTAALGLATASVETDQRGFVRVDDYLRTSAPHVFAAGDVTGRLMLVPEAIRQGFVAATNAVRGETMQLEEEVTPIGSFTDPEYAQVGLTEANARKNHEIVTVILRFDSTTRTIIDGRTTGFCKLIVDRASYKILGCHVVGDRAVEISQVAAIAIASGMRVDALAHVPLSFPTYAGTLGRAAAMATRQLNTNASKPAHEAENVEVPWK